MGKEAGLDPTSLKMQKFQRIWILNPAQMKYLEQPDRRLVCQPPKELGDI